MSSHAAVGFNRSLPDADADCSPPPASRRGPRGFTLIEMLVVVVITLIMMFAVVEVFALLGDSVHRGRGMIELTGQLRNVVHRLQQDLDGLTCHTLPWSTPDNGGGYLEYVEGPTRDSSQAASIWGDYDDVFMFTSRSKGRPFVGPGGLESEVAEIAWWIRKLGNQSTLYRRVRLIRPDQGASNMVTNQSLAALRLRQNRVAHAGGFPHAFGSLNPLTGNDEGADVMLHNCVGFDIRVYDAVAPLRAGTGAAAGVALAPGDPGYTVPTGGAVIGRGAFVDLNYAGDRSVSFYSGPPNARSGLANSTPAMDTWPRDYEHDGVDQHNDGSVDPAPTALTTATRMCWPTIPANSKPSRPTRTR